MNLTEEQYKEIKERARAWSKSQKEEEDAKYERRHKFYVDFVDRASGAVIAAAILGAAVGFVLGVGICCLAYVFL